MADQLKYFDSDGETEIIGGFTMPPAFPDTPAGRTGTLVAATGTTAVLEAAASARSGDYQGFRLGITANTGAGQWRAVTKYKGSDRTCTVTPAWDTIPDATSDYALIDARLICVQNVSDRAVSFDETWTPGVKDASSLFLMALDPDALIPPYNVTLTLGPTADGGTWSGTGTQYYRVVTLLGSDTTNGSQEASVTVDDTTKRVTVAWSEDLAGDGYKVYRSDTSGSYTTPALVFTTADNTEVSFVDDGSTPSSGALPLANTTGGVAPFYGTPPTLAAGTLTIGTLDPGQQARFWIGWLSTSGLARGNYVARLTPEAT